tara:strand:+ start:5253 stop:6206 length:954 start_codon:yes stop_codon:yes gene_type:complete
MTVMAGLMAFNGFLGGGNVVLGNATDDQLRQLSLNTGISYDLLKSQQRAEMASAGSQGLDGEAVIPTVELKLKSNPKNPRKARKKNIKILRKALRPPNYNLGLFKIYRYNAPHECACCGVDVRRFLEGDNAYAHIEDEKTGLSLADTYWFNEDTGKAIKPHARTHADHGDEMNSTYCPAHLHIYHTLKSLLDEQEFAEDGFTSRKVSKGTKFMKVTGMGALTKGFKSAENRSTPESILKYESFFKMIHADAEHGKGIKIMQYENPISGIVDFVTVSFDLRILQTEQNLMQSNFVANQSLTANQMNMNEQPQAGQQQQ